jgi:hypothetical protein
MGIYFCNTTNCPGHTSFAARCGVVTRDYSNYDYPALNTWLRDDGGDSTPTEPVEIDTEPAEPFSPANWNKAKINLSDKKYRNSKNLSRK